MARVKHLKTHYGHTVHLYGQLTDYFRFMVYDGNIEEPTYEMMQKTLDEMFEQYKDVYCDLEDIKNPESEEYDE